VQPNGSRRRAQFYEEQFAYKDGSTTLARDRVIRDAPIIAELRTNVIVRPGTIAQFPTPANTLLDQG
jgi:hypothetical protein